jgi:hypothetical protein
MILLVGSVLAAEDRQVINMKTIDFFIVQFEVENVNDIDLRTCVPYISTSDSVLKSHTTFSPGIFDLPPDKIKIVNTRFDDLPVGFYEGELNVKCERWFDGEIVDVSDIINPRAEPQYELLVSPAGEGQDYVFIPVQSYNFISRSGGVESARFTIANTGQSSLEVDIVPSVEYQSIISVVPRQASIRSGERQSFQITVLVPNDFNGFETNLTINIGDYIETFPIIGEKEGFTVIGGAVAQNFIQGTVSAGTLKIPTWIVVVIILVGGGFLLYDKKIKKTRRARWK